MLFFLFILVVTKKNCFIEIAEERKISAFPLLSSCGGENFPISPLEFLWLG